MQLDDTNPQNSFLNTTRKERKRVQVYLVSGIRLVGSIESFDAFVVMLSTPGGMQTIYKRAISTIQLDTGTRPPGGGGGARPPGAGPRTPGSGPVRRVCLRKATPRHRWWLRASAAPWCQAVQASNAGRPGRAAGALRKVVRPPCVGCRRLPSVADA